MQFLLLFFNCVWEIAILQRRETHKTTWNNHSYYNLHNVFLYVDFFTFRIFSKVLSLREERTEPHVRAIINIGLWRSVELSGQLRNILESTSERYDSKFSLICGVILKNPMYRARGWTPGNNTVDIKSRAGLGSYNTEGGVQLPLE